MVEAIIFVQEALPDDDASFVYIGDVAEDAAEHDEEARRRELLHRDQGQTRTQLGHVLDAAETEAIAVLGTCGDAADADYWQNLAITPAVVVIREVVNIEDAHVACCVDAGSRVEDETSISGAH